MEQGIRLAKYIALRTDLSRRNAEKAIFSGYIEVDEKRVDTPAFLVYSHHRVSINKTFLPSSAPVARLWRYHKPPGYLVTRTDPFGRPIIFSHLSMNPQGRVVTVGRLDQQSEGLLLLTNTPRLASFLEHPNQGLIRQYYVHISSNQPIERIAPQLRTLEKGIILDGIRYRPCRIKILSWGAQNIVHIALQEGKKREIRLLLASIGLHVQRLIRYGYGPFLLEDLPYKSCQEIPFADFGDFYHAANGTVLSRKS